MCSFPKSEGQPSNEFPKQNKCNFISLMHHFFDGNFYKLDEKGEPTATTKPKYLKSGIPV